MIHEVFMDLTFHLAAYYFGHAYGLSIGIGAADIVLIILKEIIEIGRQQASQGAVGGGEAQGPHT